MLVCLFWLLVIAFGTTCVLFVGCGLGLVVCLSSFCWVGLLGGLICVVVGWFVCLVLRFGFGLMVVGCCSGCDLV